MTSEYKVGDKVRKVTGDYQLNGEIRAVFETTAGKVRVVVEHKPGFLHIYSEANISLNPRCECQGQSVCDHCNSHRVG